MAVTTLAQKLKEAQHEQEAARMASALAYMALQQADRRVADANRWVNSLQAEVEGTA